MSQWVGEIIDTKQLGDQLPGSFIQDPGKSRSFTQNPGGRKTNILPQKLDLATHHIIM